MLPANNESFELSIGVDTINAKLISVGECKDLDEVISKVSALGCQPLEGRWLAPFQQKFSDKSEKGYRMVGFLGKPAGRDRIFPYICIEGGCNWKSGKSHTNWAEGFFADFWLFTVTEV